jgi:hypothetical protein
VRIAAGVLTLAGLVAVLTAILPVPWMDGGFFLVFGSIDRIEGPFGLPSEWETRLALITGILGGAALALGGWSLARRRTPRVPATLTTALLLAGTAFLAGWLIDPPELPAQVGVGTTSAGWGAYLATVSLAVAACAAAALARATGDRR